LAEEGVIAPEAQRTVDSQATQWRAVALYFVSDIEPPLPAGLTSMIVTSDGSQATCVPCGLRWLKAG
jgi:hypothetical protein